MLPTQRQFARRFGARRCASYGSSRSSNRTSHRDLLVRQRTQLINALRAHLPELRIVAAQGREGFQDLLTIVADNEDRRVPTDARAISTRTGTVRRATQRRTDEF